MYQLDLSLYFAHYLVLLLLLFILFIIMSIKIYFFLLINNIRIKSEMKLSLQSSVKQFHLLHYILKL